MQAYISGGRIQQLGVKKVQQGSEGKSDFLPSNSRLVYGLRPTAFELSKSPLTGGTTHFTKRNQHCMQSQELSSKSYNTKCWHTDCGPGHERSLVTISWKAKIQEMANKV